MLQKSAAVNQDIRTIMPSEKLLSGWLLQFIVARNVDLLRRYGKTGTTVESVDFQSIKGMAIALPSLPEQRLIGTLFRDVDDLITLRQREQKSMRGTESISFGAPH